MLFSFHVEDVLGLVLRSGGRAYAESLRVR